MGKDRETRERVITVLDNGGLRKFHVRPVGLISLLHSIIRSHSPLRHPPSDVLSCTYRLSPEAWLPDSGPVTEPRFVAG
jgi:hypothetical protein